jgi:hypothetical protein
MYSTNMLDYQQWVFWRKEWDAEKGKFKKQPMNPNLPGQFAKSNDPSTWASWATVRSFWEARQYMCSDWHGIGFVFTKNDPFVFIDVDGCELNTLGFDDGVFIEKSMSGNGYHLITVGKHPGCGYAKKLGPYEMYDDGRFVAMTWNTIAGDVTNLTNNQIGVDLFCWRHLNKGTVGAGAGGGVEKYDYKHIPWDKGPDPEWDGPEDDDELINVMLTDFTYNAGRKHLIAALWHHDEAALMEADDRFIKVKDGAFDWSRADLSLMNALADFTGDDPARMDRLFRRSTLFREHRWNENYQTRTIAFALNRDDKYRRIYRRPVPQTVVAPIVLEHQPQTDRLVNGMPEAKYGADVHSWCGQIAEDVLTLDQQIVLFRGCVYVESRNEIFTPDGRFLTEGQFKNGAYGGHTFIMDKDSKNTRNAWEAFTQNRLAKFPKVIDCVFRPDLPQGVITVDGDRVLNTYVKANVHKTYGDDVSPFLSHLAKMFPDARDRQIITSYMAAVVQYPGVKFQWCPVIQGTEGNGKSLLIRCITYAVGDRYTHSVNSQTLADGGGKFNKWIENKLFIDFEEIYTGDRRDMMEILKPIVTNPRIEIQGKGANQYTGDNRANIMMATNHKDAIIKTHRDRRYAILYTAQQSLEDCHRDGMGEGYFPDLYGWLNAGGYAAVAGWLERYSIPDELNPATTCQRAPETSCTEEAVTASLGVVEQYITEWVETQRVGFRGGFISSTKLDEALKEVGMAARVAPNRRKSMLESLGYVPHPNLTEGKSHIELISEGGKRPRIYVKRSNSIISGLSDKNEIMNLYCRSQNYAA